MDIGLVGALLLGQALVERLQYAAGVLAEGLTEMAVSSWPVGPQRLLTAAVLTHQAEDVATLAKACEVLIR